MDDMTKTKKGELIPQTVENLQAIMARDAFTIESMDKEIGQLKSKINQLQQKQIKQWNRIYSYKDLIVRLRNAFADYKRSEGCSCCRNTEDHTEAEKRLATLLNVPAYKDGSGFDFSQYQSKR